MKNLTVGAYLLLALLRYANGATTSTSSDSSTTGSAGTTNTTTSFEASLTEIPTGSGATYPDQGITSTYSTSSAFNNATASLHPSNQTATSTSTSSATETELGGTRTASAISNPSSGVRCNGYTEFCNRKYSNVTYVVAHNSPFHKPNNAASNQDFDVTTQLNNGIRGSESPSSRLWDFGAGADAM